MSLYIGLMSGTSMDGVDGVLVHPADASRPLTVLAHEHQPFQADLRSELLALNSSGADELHRAAIAGNAIARIYAEVVGSLLASVHVSADSVTAIGAHGQTVRHRPHDFDGTGYTLQLNAPALLAELTHIDVVSDFRSRDIAAGGTGAPLVPAFHRAVFGTSDATIGVLNLGGIGNLTVLDQSGTTIGFDCGPGNALLDHWCATHLGLPFDDGGRWSASGIVVEPLLASLLQEPYLALPAPKSTGRDLFNGPWLERHLSAFSQAALRPQDVQATLAEFTAAVCARDLRVFAPRATALYVCGGGAFNGDLMRRLRDRLPAVAIEPTDTLGLPALQVEACAFAWLAQAHVGRKAGNLSSVTGAQSPRILGALYPA
ncbi:MAG: anhydro-N-acetylmuramic acid kinase [Caldimonas sp.]